MKVNPNKGTKWKLTLRRVYRTSSSQLTGTGTTAVPYGTRTVQPYGTGTRTAVPVPVHCTVLVQYLVQYLVLPYLLVLRETVLKYSSYWSTASPQLQK
jgi:hypothetical protein